MATPDAKSRTPLFISYSHKDKIWYEQFEEILHASNLNEWSDSKIEVSENWDTKIQDALSEARIALLLISPTFLSSEYIQKRELPAILHAHREEEPWLATPPRPPGVCLRRCCSSDCCSKDQYRSRRASRSGAD